MKKYINIKNWTTQRLKKEAVELFDLVHNIQCFGTKDLILLNEILEELLKRKIYFQERNTLTFLNPNEKNN